MNIKVSISIIIAAAAMATTINSAFAEPETTPQNMTCREFMDMNPKYMTPIAFWVVNRNTDFQGGDYVHWHEVETIAVPKIFKQCESAPATKLGDLTPVSK